MRSESLPGSIPRTMSSARCNVIKRTDSKVAMVNIWLRFNGYSPCSICVCLPVRRMTRRSGDEGDSFRVGGGRLRTSCWLQPLTTSTPTR